MPDAIPPSANAALSACRAVLAPLAEMALAYGVRCAELEALMRACFVDAAVAAHPGVPAGRAVSRISAATGLNRREVARLLDTPATPQPRKRSPATETFTRWISDPAYRGPDDRPLVLPRQGEAPSFEALAQSVTRDVHPRSLLEEVCRLGLARWDTDTDRVALLRDVYVPRGDEQRLLGVLGANTGDHLRATVENLKSAGAPPHLERSLFADELSAEAVARLTPLFEAQWQALVRALAPQLQQLIDDDRAAGRVQDQRVRVGLYTFHAPMGPGPEDHDKEHS
jgi:hypothetical protein